VAFPALQRQFGAGLASVQWVSLAYLLVLTALLVPAGRWSDRAGRKLMYLYGFVVFAGSSAACGLAPSLGALIALRVVQAGGAALLQANSVALVVTSVPARARRAALGLAAAIADRLLPVSWPNSRRCLLGGTVAACCAAALAVPAPHAVSVVLLGLLGIGLGIYTPANNAEIMAAVPAGDAAAAGGIVNMTRGIGTALGVAVVALGLHAGTLLRSPDAGLALSMAALAVVALFATAAALRARPAPDGPR
jgi:MFS family permease